MTSDTPKQRLPRPRQYKVDEAALYDAWKPFANQKDPGFHWDGSDYSRTSRALGGEDNGLLVYADLLVPLLQQAPSAFPTYHSMRQVLQKLHSDHSIFGDVPAKHEFAHVSDATEKYRNMCKDLYEIKKSEAGQVHR